jgi:alpha-tubulin suppressor-like RCC1 family protein
VPTQLGVEVFGGAPVIMVSCGDAHTLVLTARARVWSCGFGGNGRLGHGDGAYKLQFWPLEQGMFGSASIVAVAAGSEHSTAVTACALPSLT